MSAKHLFPIHYYRDASGNPLAGGKVYTYISGTTTGKSTYTDGSGEVMSTNPIILDNSGRADIWMDTDVPYTLVIKDSSDTQIGAQLDEVVPIVAQAVSVGASNIDLTGYSIITTSNTNIPVTPNGIGKVKICGNYKLPNTAPNANDALTGTGTETLIWGPVGVSTLDNVTDAAVSSGVTGDIVKYNSGSGLWVNSPQSSLSITSSQVSDLASSAVTFSNKTGAISQWTNDSGYITASSSSALTNKTGNISQWTNDSEYSTLTVGSQANAEAATSSAVAMTPLIMQNHPGVAKVMLNMTNGNPPTNNGSYNIASITRTSTGVVDIVFTTAFSSANYVIDIGASEYNDGVDHWTTITNRATTGFTLTTKRNFFLVDTAYIWGITCYGDQ